jgi:3-deoxy-D-arabino-heptulosonate 7-phosphate (DAHP) synthase
LIGHGVCDETSGLRVTLRALNRVIGIKQIKIRQVHPCPEQALSDGDQSLSLEAFDSLMRDLRAFAEAAGRSLPELVLATPEAA